MKKSNVIIIILIFGALFLNQGFVLAAPASTILRNILPESSGNFDIGSTTPNSVWKNVYTTNLTVTGLTSQNCVGTDGNGLIQAGVCGGEASLDFNYVVGAEGIYLTPTSTIVGLLTNASSTIWKLTTGFSTSTNATSTSFHSNFGNFSTSTIGNLLTGTVTATSTTASSSFKDLFWIDGQATSLSLSGGLTALGALSGSNLSGTNTGDITLAGTPNYLTLSGQQITLTKLDISDDTNATAGVGLTLTANDFACDTATSVAFGCLTAADWTTFNSKQATISATWPVILTGATLSFDGLSTSTAAVIGNIPYFSGVNTFANVATGTVSGSGGINVTAGRSAIGGALAISADCTTITGGAGLCDGVDDTSAGGAFAWTPTTWGGVAANSTSTLLLLNAGAVISTSSVGQLTVGTLTATSTTASTTLDDFFFVQGQGTGLSVTNATIGTQLAVTPLTSAILLTGATGILAEYTGATCTNQFIRSLSVLGAATCETVANTDLANSTISGIALGSNLADLTATNGTLTFSGTYTGATARTIGLNLASSNLWTASTTILNLSSVLSTSTQATSTNLHIIATGYLTIPQETAPVMGTAGQIALDTTDNQFLIATSTNNDPIVLPSKSGLRFRVSSTSAPFFSGFSSGKLIGLPSESDGYSTIAITCSVWGGTSIVVNLTDAQDNDSNQITCGTATSTTAIQSNGTFTALEGANLETGTVTGTPNFLYINITRVWTRE